MSVYVHLRTYLFHRIHFGVIFSHFALLFCSVLFSAPPSVVVEEVKLEHLTASRPKAATKKRAPKKLTVHRPTGSGARDVGATVGSASITVADNAGGDSELPSPRLEDDTVASTVALTSQLESETESGSGAKGVGQLRSQARALVVPPPLESDVQEVNAANVRPQALRACPTYACLHMYGVGGWRNACVCMLVHRVFICTSDLSLCPFRVTFACVRT